jgi:hypothetical protein
MFTGQAIGLGIAIGVLITSVTVALLFLCNRNRTNGDLSSFSERGGMNSEIGKPMALEGVSKLGTMGPKTWI